MIVPPVPILFLLITIQLAKIAIVTMIFDHPLMVIDPFVIVSAMILVVIRVVDAIAAGCTAGGHGRREERGGQQQRTEVSVSRMHGVVPPFR